MAQKLFPASNPRDDLLFNELFYRQHLLDHPNPVVKVITPSVADTDFMVTHDLGRVPNGWILIHSDAPVQLYGDAGTWTKTEMTLRATETDVECTIVIV